MKNKYGEALDRIVFNYGLSALDDETNDILDAKFNNDVKLIMSLINKETPMKLMKSQIDGYRECGNCNSIVVSTNYTLPNYCSKCGQKIDWSDND